MAEITVIGAGVVGLTTALALQERGHTVRVIGAAVGPSITSAVAGAIWFPFRAEPRQSVVRWADATRRWLRDLAQRDPTAGVDMLRAMQMESAPERPWWGEGIEDLRPLPSTPADPLPGGAPHAWTFAAPRVDPTHHMPWLLSRLHAPIEQRRLDSLEELTRLPGLVINCTGLGARTLVNDPRVTPLYGQVVVAEPAGLDLSLTISDERHQGEVFYVIPRRAEVIIGGCTMPWPHPFTDGTFPAPDPDITAQILARAARYGIVPKTIRRVATGLRPFRDAVRVERDATHANLIHNYGHGGSGYTIAWGCAQDVVAMVEA